MFDLVRAALLPLQGRRGLIVSEPSQFRIVIVGGGTAGWITAAVLARFFDPRLHALTLIESDEIGTIGVGEATIPQIQLLNQALGFDEDEFVRATQATYKLGIEFAGWGDADSLYMHAFGQVGRQVGAVPFHHYWLRQHRDGNAGALGDYALNAVAAYGGRMARGKPATSALFGALGHAFHFDAGRYARFLRRYAEARGVVRLEGRIEAVEQHGESGNVTGLTLADGRSVEGDFFVDCTGFSGLLIERTLATGYEDWSHWLPCDRAVAVPSRHGVGRLTPYTRSVAQEWGWQWRIPLQNRIGNGMVYCSQAVSDEIAVDRLLGQLDGEPLADPRPLRFMTGRRRRAWNRNVVAIGLAAGFLEPLELTSIHLIQSAVERLIKFLPGAYADPADAAAYNAQTAFEWERVRDFIVLHYHLNRRAEPFWNACAAMSVPDSLTEKLELFAANGRIARFNEELFAEAGWLQVLIGQGLVPRGYHPLVDILSDAELAEMLSLMRQSITKTVAAMPRHEDFIARHCRAPAELEAA